MRIIIFFDLPTLTETDKRNYRHFQKFLVTNGFLMMQESVYSKIALNNSVVSLFRDKIKKTVPKNGLIQMLVVTEKQYVGIEYLTGKKTSTVIDSDERIVII